MRALLVLLRAWVSRRGSDWRTRTWNSRSLAGYEHRHAVFSSIMETIGVSGFRANPPTDATVLDHGDDIVSEVLAAWFRRDAFDKEVEAGPPRSALQAVGTAREILHQVGVEIPGENFEDVSQHKIINWLKRHVCDVQKLIETHDGKKIGVKLVYRKAPNGKTNSTFKLTSP